MERAAARGVPARGFAHHRPEALQRQLQQAAGGRALVLVDGFCAGCGRAAPLARYLELLRPCGGLLVLDDTQALGVWGTPRAGSAYGAGGGGSLRRAGVGGPQVLWCASLAKAFGVPLAVAAGSEACLAQMEERGETRVHCSPPSLAVLRAAQRALALNAARGEALRARLARRVRELRARLAEAGLRASGGLFPVQRLALPDAVDPAALEGRLRRRGVRAVLQRGRCGPRRSVSLLLTARHTRSELEAGAAALAEALDGAQGTRKQAEVRDGEMVPARRRAAGSAAAGIRGWAAR
nr:MULTISPECIES: aminotransferase class I/II-fold pyridoxal phosphate-dependent enzyme [Myxococcaceae]